METRISKHRPAFTTQTRIPEVRLDLLLHSFTLRLLGQPEIEYAMDMHKNNVGLEIGPNLGTVASRVKVAIAVNQALSSGKLIWIECDSKGRNRLVNEKGFQRATYKVITGHQSTVISYFPYISKLTPKYAVRQHNSFGKPIQ